MNPYSELFLRCSTLATAADIKGPLGNDIICKCIINAGLGFVMSTRTDEGHFVKLHDPITLRKKPSQHRLPSVLPPILLQRQQFLRSRSSSPPSSPSG